MLLWSTWPYLFSLSKNKKCTFEKMLKTYNARQLDIFSISNNDLLSSFHSSLELLEFIAKMNALNLSEGDDIFKWNLTPNKVFSIKSYYDFLNDNGTRSKFRNSIWRSTVSLKIKVLVWLATHDKILSTSNLVRRGCFDSPNCELCSHILEFTDYIFIYYYLSTQIWSFFP